MQGERDPYMLLNKCRLVQPPWKSVWRFLKKLKVELPYDPARPLLGNITKEIKVSIEQRHLHSHVYCNTI
jgi:hypothetical protein